MVDRSGLPVVLSYLTSELRLLYDQLMTRDLRGGGGAVWVWVWGWCMWAW